MKKFLIIVGALALVIGLGIVSVFYATSGAVETADAFFRQAAAGNFDKARPYLAEGFLASTSEEELIRFLDGSGLLDYRESDWGGRSVDTSSGKLTGKVITNSGATIPLTITFVRESGEWKIYYIQREDVGLADSRIDDVELPTRTEAAELVKSTTSAFAEAVNAGDLGLFHAQTAPEFQQEISLEEFNRLFADFVTQEIDLSVLGAYEPMFTSDPALSAQGVLRLEGYFPTRPSRAQFGYTYQSVSGEWQLIGIRFNLSPVEE